MPVVVLSVAVAAAGCGGPGRDSGTTGPLPPDRLGVTLRGGGSPAFRVDLECAVADREACAGIIAALVDAQDQPTCAPAPEGGTGALTVSGTIGGRRVGSRVARRTDCEVRTYDRIIAALGL